jgi:peptidoglycan/LPS O-acetylase OafA/YrhL
MTTKPVSLKQPLSRIDEFDGLRGILALWVALSHVFCWCGFATFPFGLPHWLGAFVGRFWVQFSFASGAVDTFIILSGFAISFMLHARTQTYGQFMTGRFFRIYPVYFICLLAGFFSIYLMPFVLTTVGWQDNEYFNLYVRPPLASELAHPGFHLVSHLTLLFGVIPEIMLPHASTTLLPPAWSITLEWQYYLLAPFLAWFVLRPSGLLALGIIGSGGLIYSHFWSNAFLPAELPLFLVGIGSYHLYAHAEDLKSFPNRRNIFAALIAATLIVGWHWLALLLWIFAFGSVLADRNDRAEDFLQTPRRLLLQPALQFVGKISYPLYLVHWPVIIFLLAGLIRCSPGISPGLALATMLLIGLPVMLFVSWLLHQWVEKPLMKFGKKFS